MNYPVWYLPDIGGGILIALISIVHVFLSHFAVGGGLYLVLAERKGLRENNPAILEFTKKHAKFFMLVTMVMGGITGVGIWFIISLVNPSATSVLIHTFVFGWATEWVFFLVEIVAIFVFYYCFGSMDSKTHQVVGWIYFIAAWLSLFVINGIIGFMLTPGGWIVDGSFWSGFFNPSFWPSLFFRTFVSLMLAGVYAFVTTAFLKDAHLKLTMTRYSARWVLLSLLAAVPSGYWYLSILPNQARILVEGASPTIRMTVQYGLAGVIFLLAGTLILLLLKPTCHTKAVSFIVLVSAFLFMGAFEWTREASRRPYVIDGFMYSNSVLEKDLEEITREGFLHEARWVSTREARADNQLEAGREIFRNQCYACHTVRGINNPIVVRTAAMDYAALVNYLGRMHDIRYFMPPFAGNEAERKALAYFVIKGIQGKDVTIPKAQRKQSMSEGGVLFLSHCTICHPESLVKSRSATWDQKKIRWALDNLNRLQSAMPNFQGTPEEKDQIAAYIYSLQGGADKENHNEGEEVFEKNCAICHTLREGANPLLPKLKGWTRERLRSSLDMLQKLKGGMPPLDASNEEKDALTTFLYRALEGELR
ncbi:MAG: c-type cytochrome [Geobacteraceae bacterium]|nr:c-type cytochrome [Geobacteraceae bacterium]